MGIFFGKQLFDTFALPPYLNWNRRRDLARALKASGEGLNFTNMVQKNHCVFEQSYNSLTKIKNQFGCLNAVGQGGGCFAPNLFSCKEEEEKEPEIVPPNFCQFCGFLSPACRRLNLNWGKNLLLAQFRGKFLLENPSPYKKKCIFRRRQWRTSSSSPWCSSSTRPRAATLWRKGRVYNRLQILAWCFDCCNVVTNYLTYYRVIRTLAESKKSLS